MNILGFQKTTLLDYPGHVAATVFTGGCNFYCPFCHNKGLVNIIPGEGMYAEEDILSHLEKRKDILDGVCVTGGEPTLQPDLEDFLRKIKSLGLLVKLDTNGSRPAVLRRLLESQLLDYVAMDIKAAPEKYSPVSGCEEICMEDIRESIRLLMQGGVPYEFRTTVVKGLHSPEEFEEIGKLIRGCQRYYLQSYRESEQVIAPGFEAFSKEEMEEIAERARKYIDKVELRGVE